MTALIGAAGLGAEASYWYVTKRDMQNAADSAAVAAAANGSDNYEEEAKANAARYNFTHGVGGVSVTATNPTTCPSGAAKCYQVTINRTVPLFLAQVIGVTGNGNGTTTISATAVATIDPLPREYCILALGGSGDPEALRTNGAPKANLSGCNLMSNTAARCNGHDLDADYGDAAKTNSGCGDVRRSNVAPVEDPYDELADNIPDIADANCNNVYPQRPKKNKDPDLPASNRWNSTNAFLQEVKHVCGDLELTSDVTVSTPAGGTVLVIWNGGLFLNNRTLKTGLGSALTIIFAGSNGTYSHAPEGNGTLDIAAPTSGPWKGIALYQAPHLTTGVNISEAGNSPTWKITGLVYLPRASVTFSGAVNKSSNGASCFGMVVDNITINGTGSILATGGCDEAGLELPEGKSDIGRGQLVL